MLMINHVSQESATLITPRTALGIEILLLHFRHDVQRGNGYDWSLRTSGRTRRT